jgi:DNA (cytosine-5)-methyltransferase 3A
MRILSLFDGKSCGRIALERAGVSVTKYFASEVDKFSIIVSKSNYPNVIQLGDVVRLRKLLQMDLVALNGLSADDLVIHVIDIKRNGIDILIGGSPCQGFSFAGKHLNFEDERSALFFEFVKIRDIIKPRYFFLENVRMKKEIELQINRIMGVKPYKLNSNLVSAQNRLRYYWTNIKIKSLPIDKGIVLKDILQTIEEVGEKYSISNKMLSRLNVDKIDYIGFVGFSNEGKEVSKSSTLSAMDYKGMCNQGINVVKTKIIPVNPKLSNGLQTKMQDRIFDSNGLSPCLTSFCNTLNVKHQYAFRRLTPIECERLQTVPDNYTAAVSNSQRYKMLGNGWTIDIIAFFFKHINSKKNNNGNPKKRLKNVENYKNQISFRF